MPCSDLNRCSVANCIMANHLRSIAIGGRDHLGRQRLSVRQLVAIRAKTKSIPFADFDNFDGNQQGLHISTKLHTDQERSVFRLSFYAGTVLGVHKSYGWIIKRTEGKVWRCPFLIQYQVDDYLDPPQSPVSIRSVAWTSNG